MDVLRRSRCNIAWPRPKVTSRGSSGSCKAGGGLTLWVTCVQSAQHYGLDAVGVTPALLKKVHTQTMQHLGSPRHITRESDKDLLLRLGVDTPRDILRKSIQRRWDQLSQVDSGVCVSIGSVYVSGSEACFRRLIRARVKIQRARQSAHTTLQLQLLLLKRQLPMHVRCAGRCSMTFTS